MSFTHRIKRGSTRPVLRYPLPAGINLVGAQAALIMSPRPGQPAVVNAPAIIASIAPPVVEYAWQQGDTVQDGTFYAEIEVTFPDGGSQTFPEQGYFAVVIDKDLGDGGVIVPSLIQMSAAMAEAGADTAAGSASVGIALSGAVTEPGSDTASGTATVTNPAPGAITLSAALVEAGADTASGVMAVTTPAVAPAFTTQPALLGSTALGSTITVSLGAASGTPAPTLTGTLTRPGKAAAAVADGATFAIEAADQGGTITLGVTATNSAGSATASAALAVPAAATGPTVQNVQDGGYIGTTASIDQTTGKVTVNNTTVPEVVLPGGEFSVGQWCVRVDGIQGKNLAVEVRGAYNFNNNAAGWRAAWAYDLLGPWYRFDSDPLSGGVTQASNNSPATQNTVYIANKPLMLQPAWDAAIARWKASPHTHPTASGNADFVVGLLPAITGRAPAKNVHGFKFGTGALAAVLTTGVHPEEHFGMHAFEGFVDFVLGSDPVAMALREKFTFYAYPNLNAQGRYVGAARVEVETGTAQNSNRIWSSAFDHINLSRIMRQIWAADLPAQREVTLDFHDVPHVANRAAELLSRNATDLVSAIGSVYTSRTGRTVTTGTSTAIDSIGDYLAATRHLAIEHATPAIYGGDELRAWGRDIAAGLNAAYTVSAPGPWQSPQWVSAPGVTITPDAGGWTVTGTDVAPKAAFLIPAGNTIEVEFEGNCSGADTASTGAFIRQGETPAIPSATSTQIGATIPRGTFSRTVIVSYDPAKPYIGIIVADNTGTTRTATLTANTRYRVLP